MSQFFTLIFLDLKEPAFCPSNFFVIFKSKFYFSLHFFVFLPFIIFFHCGVPLIVHYYFSTHSFLELMLLTINNFQKQMFILR